MVAMRDGVRLATDIYYPSDDGAAPAGGRHPLLLKRTPYSKQRPPIGGRADDEDQVCRQRRPLESQERGSAHLSSGRLVRPVPPQHH